MSNPTDLEPYRLAYKRECDNTDRQMHSWFGSYGISALVFAIDHCLNGRKASTKYMDNCLSDLLNEETDEDKLQKQREMFVAGLLAMQANFEITHPKGDKAE